MTTPLHITEAARVIARRVIVRLSGARANAGLVRNSQNMRCQWFQLDDCDWCFETAEGSHITVASETLNGAEQSAQLGLLFAARERQAERRALGVRDSQLCKLHEACRLNLRQALVCRDHREATTPAPLPDGPR